MIDCFQPVKRLECAAIPRHGAFAQRPPNEGACLEAKPIPPARRPNRKPSTRDAILPWRGAYCSAREHASLLAVKGLIHDVMLSRAA